MDFKDEIVRLIANWNATPEEVLKFIEEIKWVKESNSKSACIAMLLSSIALAKAYEMPESGVQLMVAQFTKEIYK